MEQALSHMVTSGTLMLEEIGGEPLLFLPHLRKAEEGIAEKIKALVLLPPAFPPIDFDKAVEWCEKKTGNVIAPSQRAVAWQASVILVGDVDQLPSVEPGTVLTDLIASVSRAE